MLRLGLAVNQLKMNPGLLGDPAIGFVQLQ